MTELISCCLERPFTQCVHVFKMYFGSESVCSGVNDPYSNATNNQTLAHREISHVDNQLYNGNEG